MTLYLATLAAFALAFLAMALGALLQGRCLKGTCGGLAGLRDEQGNVLCDACSTPTVDCPGVPGSSRASAPDHGDSVSLTDSSSSSD